MNQDLQQRARIRRIAAIIAIVIVVTAVVLVEHFKNNSTAAASTPTPTTNTTQTDTAVEPSSSTPSSSTNSSATYKDGIYTQQAQYSVPRSYETIQVTVTIKNGVVTSSKVSNSEGDPKSAEFQREFTSEYQNQVIGKNLSDLMLDTVAGASDTTEGFNQAIVSIRSQAQA
jgi:uncharacterized protein with FMN-binding domain